MIRLFASRPLARLALLLALVPLPALAQQADLILRGGRIYTVDENRPMVEAMAVGGGKVLFVGSERGALTLRGPATQIIELDGQTVIPGMTDAHVHLLNLGNSLRDVPLFGTRSYEEVVARVVERARTVPAGTWIRGRGWDQNDWGVTGSTDMRRW
jgi:predicted amidohydrolase YtcJ